MAYQWPSVLGRISYPTQAVIQSNGLLGLGEFDYGDETLTLPAPGLDPADAPTPTDDYGNPTVPTPVTQAPPPALGVPPGVLAAIAVGLTPANRPNAGGASLDRVNAWVTTNASTLVMAGVGLFALSVVFGGKRRGRR